MAGSLSAAMDILSDDACAIYCFWLLWSPSKSTTGWKSLSS